MTFDDSRKDPSVSPKTELELDGQAISTAFVEAGASSSEGVEASHYLTGWRLYILAVGWVFYPSLLKGLHLDINDNEDLLGRLPGQPRDIDREHIAGIHHR